MTRLRNIAVVVVEPAPGHFVWQLREAVAAGSADGWSLLEQASSGQTDWIEAFNEGVNMVLQMTRDARKGPRPP